MGFDSRGSIRGHGLGRRRLEVFFFARAQKIFLRFRPFDIGWYCMVMVWCVAEGLTTNEPVKTDVTRGLDSPIRSVGFAGYSDVMA